MQVSSDARKSFYDVAALGLHALEAQPHGRRRFDTEAVARWRSFQGELLDADRLDLLVRDAAVGQPAAFAPRVVFDLPGLTEDEPFGPDWPGADARAAHALLQPDRAVPTELTAVLETACAAWGVHPSQASVNVAFLTAATRLLVSGPAAIIAVAQAFQGRAGFDFADQVVVLADNALERQLAGLTAAVLGTSKPARTIAPDATLDTLRKLAPNASLVSADASRAAHRAFEAWKAAGVLA
jgi:hypothetical protein